MKVGDLVKIKRARIGAPSNTIGLITECNTHYDDDMHMPIFIVQLTEHPKYGARIIRSLSRDLEVISEDR
jgi:hypothetical protein